MAKNEVSLFDQFVSLIRLTYTNWRNDRTLRLGAGLSYYVVFSLVPTLALTVFLASLFFSEQDVIDYFRQIFTDLFQTSGADPSEFLANESVVGTVQASFKDLGLFGIASLVVTASFAMLALIDSVNMIWGRPVEHGMKNMVRRYAFSYIIVLLFASFLIILLTVQTVLAFVEGVLKLDGPVIENLTGTLMLVVTWALVIFALTWLIRVLSFKKVSWKAGVMGSVITVGFMYLGVKAIGFYLTNFSFNSVTSAFSAVILILLWVYYESQILLAGFQLTKTLSEGKYHYGEK